MSRMSGSVTKDKRGNIICTCDAYKFPHRLLGGKCDGSEWAAQQRTLNRPICQYCNLNTGNQCEAITGVESLKEGDCYEVHKGE